MRKVHRRDAEAQRRRGAAKEGKKRNADERGYPQMDADRNSRAPSARKVFICVHPF
jgi:hypothetical protein